MNTGTSGESGCESSNATTSAEKNLDEAKISDDTSTKPQVANCVECGNTQPMCSTICKTCFAHWSVGHGACVNRGVDGICTDCGEYATPQAVESD